MQKILNLKVKYRESFRPFAPSVLREDVADWFELEATAPTCCWSPTCARTRRRAMTAEEQALFGIDKLNVSRSEIPAVTHVDYSARIQTVHRETNPRSTPAERVQGRSPAARCWSTPASTCAASRSSARRRTPSAASWAPRSSVWWSAIASCARASRIRPEAGLQQRLRARLTRRGWPASIRRSAEFFREALPQHARQITADDLVLARAVMAVHRHPGLIRRQ